MHKLSQIFSIRRKLFLSIAALVTLGIPIAFTAAHAKTSHAQLWAFNLNDFKFEVVSLKPTKNPEGEWYLHDTSDGISGVNVHLMLLVKEAYGIYEDYRYAGGPEWLSSETYSVEAKMDASVADQYRKLPRDQRLLAKRHMIQVLLEERFNMKAHRETKEFPVYFLVVAKGGPKFRESKPNPDDPTAPKNAVWKGPGMKGGMMILSAKLMPISQLAQTLSEELGRMVVDKTGLTGTYDFDIQYALERGSQPISGGSSEGQPIPFASEPTSGPSVFTALESQLGLKLDSGKAPIEIIVIDHIERASGN
jgi:uncharacterized protein (TIGR03435 family)